MTHDVPEQYFVLVYDVPHMNVEVHEFEQDRERAVAEYAALEERYRKDDAIEVVLVGADSIKTIQKTHSHYFATTKNELLDQFLTDIQNARKQELRVPDASSAVD
jgi:hypothetical protein